MLPLSQVLTGFLTSLSFFVPVEFGFSKCDSETRETAVDSVPKKENIWK